MKRQPKLYTIWQFRPSTGWIQSSFVLALSRGALLTTYPQYGDKNKWLIIEPK